MICSMQAIGARMEKAKTFYQSFKQCGGIDTISKCTS